VRKLVTGRAGSIGSNFVHRTVDGTYSSFSSVIVLDKITYAGSLTNLSELQVDVFKFVKGYICKVELLRRLVGERNLFLYMDKGEIVGRGAFEEVGNSALDFDRQAKLMDL
jgi:dTDP-glucose 4,6-dehydratase